jgi:hypothetical protein
LIGTDSSGFHVELIPVTDDVMWYRTLDFFALLFLSFPNPVQLFSDFSMTAGEAVVAGAEAVPLVDGVVEVAAMNINGAVARSTSWRLSWYASTPVGC